MNINFSPGQVPALLRAHLPGYSTELNPDETVWSYVKHHVVGKKIVTGTEQFLKVVKAALYSLLLSLKNHPYNIYEVIFMQSLVAVSGGGRVCRESGFVSVFYEGAGLTTHSSFISAGRPG
ncbi:MAG: hypothetical protein LBP37_05585 [Spirochaetaceae bacterium]|nr:hypothetical protein [Spirochaetaceae bacterium]